MGETRRIEHAKLEEILLYGKRMQSFLGLLPVIERDGIAYKFYEGPDESAVGAKMMATHFLADYLDDHFVANGAYQRKHVPVPIDMFNLKIGDNNYSGYAYEFTKGIDNFDCEHEGVPRKIDEWHIFQELMKRHGFDFSSRNFDTGAWAGGSAYFENIVYFGSKMDDKFTNEWVVIDFCDRHVMFSEEIYCASGEISCELK